MPAGASVESPGTTSAHAENTKIMAWAPACTWNYLRARGEYGDGHGACVYCRELPPRTRRIHAPAGVNNLVDGTTSAHAENTGTHRHGRTPNGNYLRARGEYRTKSDISGVWGELPPRTRRIQVVLISQVA